VPAAEAEPEAGAAPAGDADAPEAGRQDAPADDGKA
jgi:hypothetical protein